MESKFGPELVDFAKNTLFNVICSPQRTLMVSMAGRYIRRTILETIGRLAAIFN